MLPQRAPPARDEPHSSPRLRAASGTQIPRPSSSTVFSTVSSTASRATSRSIPRRTRCFGASLPKWLCLRPAWRSASLTQPPASIRALPPPGRLALCVRPSPGRLALCVRPSPGRRTPPSAPAGPQQQPYPPERSPHHTHRKRLPARGRVLRTAAPQSTRSGGHLFLPHPRERPRRPCPARLADLNPPVSSRPLHSPQGPLTPLPPLAPHPPCRRRLGTPVSRASAARISRRAGSPPPHLLSHRHRHSRSHTRSHTRSHYLRHYLRH